MKITDLINKDTIILDLKSKDKEAILDELIDKLYTSGKLNDKEDFKRGILKREAEASTGLGDGIAIPHAKTKAVKNPAIAFGRSQEGLDFNSLDGEKTNLFFMLAASEGADRDHLDTISKLATFLMDKDFTKSLLTANSLEEIIEVIANKEREVDDKKNKREPIKAGDRPKLLAVTSCPTGIAHTYMAEDALKKKADEMGIDIKIETNGAIGVGNLLTKEDIREAKAIIVATDTKTNMDRFVGKKLIQTGVSEAIKNPQGLIIRALDGEETIYKGKSEVPTNTKNFGESVYDSLMNGVSNMLPFVIGGGILIALSFLLDFNNSGSDNYGFGSSLALFFNQLGVTAFSFILPMLAGYIAFSIADRPALAPGFVGGALAENGNAGFLGALIAGFLAGYLVELLKKTFDKLPEYLEGIKPVLLFPFFGILLVGIMMSFIIIPPVEGINIFINRFLSTIEGSNKVVLGLILGGMMAIDMGGPINKAAYVFGVASVAEGNGHIMAAVMAGGMVPPLGIALATSMFKEKFTYPERNAGKVNYIMGLSFITEGAIPFAEADPKSIIPSSLIGAAIAGGLSEAFGASSPAPHGGIFILPVVTNGLLYFISIVVGALVTAILLGTLKKDIKVDKIND